MVCFTQKPAVVRGTMQLVTSKRTVVVTGKRTTVITSKRTALVAGTKTVIKQEAVVSRRGRGLLEAR